MTAMIDVHYTRTEPDWFLKAVATLPQSGVAALEAGDVHYLAWGQRGAPGLILIHGGGAHAHWWDFVAPFFADSFRVVAVDLPGNGDSAHRDVYRGSDLAAAALAAAEDAECALPLTVVGHSFGGHVALATALEPGSGIRHLVLVDSPVRSANDPRRFDPKKTQMRPARVYRDIDQAVRHFRLLPEQPCENRFLMDYIARHSLRRNTHGWRWKFDPQFFPKLEIDDLSVRIPELTTATAFVYGEKSRLIDPPTLAGMKDLFGAQVPIRMLADAHHHVMLDQPLEFAAALEAQFGIWGIVPTCSEG